MKQRETTSFSMQLHLCFLIKACKEQRSIGDTRTFLIVKKGNCLQNVHQILTALKLNPFQGNRAFIHFICFSVDVVISMTASCTVGEHSQHRSSERVLWISKRPTHVVQTVMCMLSIYKKVTTQTSRLSQSVPEGEAAPAPKTWRMEKAVRKAQGHQVQIILQLMEQVWKIWLGHLNGVGRKHHCFVYCGRFIATTIVAFLTLFNPRGAKRFISERFKNLMSLYPQQMIRTPHQEKRKENTGCGLCIAGRSN